MGSFDRLNKAKNNAVFTAMLMAGIVGTTNESLAQDLSSKDKESVQTEQVDSKNTASISEIKKYVEESGVIETEEERLGFEEKWEEKLMNHAKKDKYADEIREIYTLGLDDYQTLVLILALLDPDGETPLGEDAVKRAKNNKTLAMLHKNNLFSIENDKDLGETRAEYQQKQDELKSKQDELKNKQDELKNKQDELKNKQDELKSKQDELKKAEELGKFIDEISKVIEKSEEKTK